MKKLIIGFFGLMLLAGILVLTLPTILHKAGLHPEYQGPKVALPVPPGYSQLKQLFSNTLLKSKNGMLVFLLTLLLLVPFYVAYRMSREIKK